MANRIYDSFSNPGNVLDTDIWLLSRSPHSGNTTFKTQALDVFNYVSNKSINNVVYVNSDNGVNAVERGSVLTPYATLSYALSQITTATDTNPFLIEMFGIFTETNLAIKPNIYINGNGGSLTVTNNITADSSWSGVNGIVYIYNFDKFNPANDITLDLSASASSYINLYNINTYSSIDIIFTGSSSGNAKLTNNNIRGINSFVSFNLTNCNYDMFSSLTGSITLDIQSANNFIANMDTNTIFGNLFLSCSSTGNLDITKKTTNVIGETDIVGNITIRSASSGICSVTQTSAYCTHLYTMNGVNTLLNTDAMSNSIAFLNGAVDSNVTYRTLSDTITAGFTPVSYTPTDDQVKGHLEGIDNELNIGTGRVPFGIVGGGIAGDSTFTFDISTKKLTVNKISSLSADIGSFGDGYHEITNGLSLTLTNPMPTVINVTNGGSGISITLPDMTETRSVMANELPNFFILNNGSEVVNVLNNSSSTIVSIKSGQYYMFTVTDNSTANGSFIFELTNIIVSAIAPLSISSGNTNHNAGKISISQATTSTDGYLSSTDWNTFNNKQSSISTANVDTGGANATGMNLIGAQLSLTSATSSQPGVLTAGTQTIGGNKTFTGAISAANLSGTNHGDLETDVVNTSAPNSTGMFMTNGNAATPQKLQLCAADGSNPGVITAGTQTIGGDKTFTGSITASNFSGFSNGFNHGDVSGGTLDGGIPSAIGFYLSGQQLFMQSAGTSFPGLVNTTTQTFIGTKTFQDGPVVQSGTTTVKNAIVSPGTGQLFFDTTLGKLCVYTGSAWQTITST